MSSIASFAVKNAQYAELLNCDNDALKESGYFKYVNSIGVSPVLSRRLTSLDKKISSFKLQEHTLQ